MAVIELINQGGWMMWVILSLSVLALAISADRFVLLYLRSNLNMHDFRKQIIRLIEDRENNKTLIVHALLPGMGITARGETLPSLPSSFLAMMGGQSRTSRNYARGSATATATTPWVLSGMQSTSVVIGEKE